MSGNKPRVSRRRMLKTAGSAALGGGTAALLGAGALGAQNAPTIITNTQAGRKFKALVKHDANPASIIDLTTRPIPGNRAVVRVEAAFTCYTIIGQVLFPNVATNRASIVGHGGVGVVEALGPQVSSVQVGDRVLITVHASCGRCYNCLRMRSDKCVAQFAPDTIPVASMPDGTPVFIGSGVTSELAIVREEHLHPIFTDLPAPELAVLPCTGGCGLGMAMTNCPVEVASDVVIFGAGSVGLCSLQAAKIKGASRLIVVEPIAYRRELALRLGATDVLDPNQYSERRFLPNASGWDDRYQDALVDHIRDMVKWKTNRGWAGGGRNGPDHVIEAVGGDIVAPKTERGPDPTGVRVIQQGWELCSTIGTFVTCSWGHPKDGMVQIPADQYTDGGKHHWGGTGGGTNDRRDGPRFVRLMETGQLNMKPIASQVFPLNRYKEAYQACADRTAVGTVIAPNA